jgi:DNA polymerase III subunit beta
MQFLVEHDRLLEVLTKLAGIIDGKAGIPIMKNVFVDARAAAVLLRTADTDMQLVMPCPAEVTQAGQITVDGRLLREIVRLCPKGGQIGVTLGGASKRRKPSGDAADRLRLISGKAEFALLTLPPDDWPVMAVAPDAAAFRLECRQLRALLEKTRFAVSSDETRYYLGGIYLHQLGETLAAVATDGHRLALKTVPLPAGADAMPAPRAMDDNPGPRAAADGLAAMPGVIIPKDAASVALKILPDSDIECELAISASLMRLCVGEVELIAKLIDGTFPDYQRVIPVGGVGRMIAPREALAQAVARVGVVLDGRDHAIAMHFDAETVTLTAYAHANGHSAREQLAECVSDAGAAQIGVNPRYLAEALETMDGAQLAIVLQRRPDAPVLLEEVDGDGSLRMLVMPMRLPVAGTMPGDETKQKAA